MVRFSKYASLRTQDMIIGLNLYLGSQSICIVGFGFPTMGGPMLGDPNIFPFPKLFSLPLKIVTFLS